MRSKRPGRPGYMGLIMKKLSCLLILAATLSSTAWAACKPPDSLRKFPDGKTATKEKMQDAQKVFAAFDKKIEDYRACLKGEHDATLKKNPKADDALKEELFKGYKEKDDRAIGLAERTRDDLNLEVRAFNDAAKARKAAAAK
jgi:hypothetical protein